MGTRRCRSKRVATAFVTMVALVLSLTTLPPEGLCSAADAFQNLLGQFSSYDRNKDGILEIDKLELAAFENPANTVPSDARLVLVLIEPRLLDPLPGLPSTGSDLLNALNRFGQDLRAEGYVVRCLMASVYDGSEHQDGRTVLALRDFFKEVQQEFAAFEGVVFVGSFPEAMLVRRWLWPRTAGDGGVTIDGTTFAKGTGYLQIVPEIVAERADLVLADLDGKWGDLYEKTPKNLESIMAKPDTGSGTSWYLDGATVTCARYDKTTLSFQDFFWIKDDNYVATVQGNTLKVQMFTRQLHPEMTGPDKALANPVARPELFISRINPLHIAVNPDPAFVDIYGQKFLTAEGRPQAVTSATPIDTAIKAFWKRDAGLERRLLLDFFDRNHAYRVGGYSYLPFRPAAVGKGLSAADLTTMLMKASSEFSSPITVEDASLLDYVDWLTRSACYRGIDAHSNPWNSEFGTDYTVAGLEAAVGGNPWRWKRQGSTNLYLPSLADQAGLADLYVHRTLWENGILAGGGGRLYLHNGCQANSPEGAATKPYNHPDYGTFQTAEGALFYLNGVALFTRAKIFYDTPQGFSEALGADEKSHFGEGWHAYFEEEGENGALVADVAGNKKSYPWSILGDWTVRLRYLNGFGVITLDGGKLVGNLVHADNAYVAEWNYSSSHNTIEGTGDFDNDGRSDILLSSSGGLGIISHDLVAWKCLATEPANTSFGGWVYQPAEAVFHDSGNFDGKGGDDILVSNPSGLAVLKVQGSHLTPLVAKPSGTTFGGWQYKSGETIVQGVGDFDGDGSDEILVSSPWGIGILKVQGSTLTSLVAKPSGTTFGGWQYKSGETLFQGVGDFDGDGSDDILVSSPWGIGILRVQGSSLTSLVAKPAGTTFGGWQYKSGETVFQGVGDFDADRRQDILVSSPWGLGLLKVQGSTLTSLVAKPKGTHFGGWVYNPDDDIKAIGSFDVKHEGDDILITSSWGICILTLDKDTLDSIDASAYQLPVGDWYLEKTDRVRGLGKFSGGPRTEILFKKT